MAARKAPAKATPAVPHVDDCADPRVESYDVLGPADQPVHVDRCMECGAQTTK
jgi:hypothetical protein